MIIIYRILDHHALLHNHSDTDFQTIYINADSVTDLSESLECNQTMLRISLDVTDYKMQTVLRISVFINNAQSFFNLRLKHFGEMKSIIFFRYVARIIILFTNPRQF